MTKPITLILLLFAAACAPSHQKNTTLQPIVLSVPTAKLKVASVGTLNCCVAALFIENMLPSSPEANV